MLPIRGAVVVVATKFYLHDATTSVNGTLPGSGDVTETVNGATPTLTAAGASTNRLTNQTAGTTQTSVAQATNAVTSAQSIWLRRWVLGPFAAQTIPDGTTFTLHIGSSQSNTNSNMRPAHAIAFWTPSTGTLGINQMISPWSNTAVAPGTTETATTFAMNTTNSVDLADGDVLILEVGRAATSQSMSTSYTNTLFYDGTTDDSTSSNAAYLLSSVNLLLSTAADPFPYVGGGYYG